MRFSRLTLGLIALFLAILGCALPTATPTPEVGILETMVAQTLEAIGSSTEVVLPPTAEPTLGIGETPESPDDLVLPEPAVLRIAYTNGGNVWLIEGDDPAVQLTFSGNATDIFLSSDGHKIAYIRTDPGDFSNELNVINKDGSENTVLLNQAEFDSLYPLFDFTHYRPSSVGFIPNTHLLLYNTLGSVDAPGLFKNDDLWVIDTDSGIRSQIFAPGDGGDFALSPDGSLMAIINADSIGIANSDGTGFMPDLVTFEHVITYSEFQYYPQPVWSDDSTALGVVIPSSDPLASDAEGAVWIIPTSGDPPSLLATIAGQLYFPQVFGEPLISPDLSRVAYLRDTDTLNIQQLFYANADGSGQALYAEGNLSWQGWTPAGNRFSYSFDTMNLQLGTVEAGSMPLAVGIDLRWIDASRYLYLSGSRGAWTLRLGQLGEAPVDLVSPAGDFIAFDFSE